MCGHGVSEGKDHGTRKGSDNGWSIGRDCGAGSVAVGSPVHASAEYNCRQAYALAKYYQQQGDFYYAAGKWKDATRSYQRAEDFYSYCY
jgi:hypothetical protein